MVNSWLKFVSFERWDQCCASRLAIWFLSLVVIVGCYAVYLFCWVKRARSANVVPYFVVGVFDYNFKFPF